MQYILLTVTDKEGFITGVDWLVNNKKPKKPFVLKYKSEVIQQCIFSPSERDFFYALMSLYDPEIIKRLDVFGKERKERLNKDK
jgi:hypothetical protein